MLSWLKPVALTIVGGAVGAGLQVAGTAAQYAWEGKNAESNRIEAEARVVEAKAETAKAEAAKMQALAQVEQAKAQQMSAVAEGKKAEAEGKKADAELRAVDVYNTEVMRNTQGADSVNKHILDPIAKIDGLNAEIVMLEARIAAGQDTPHKLLEREMQEKVNEVERLKKIGSKTMKDGFQMVLGGASGIFSGLYPDINDGKKDRGAK